MQDEAEAKKFPFGRQGAVRPQAKPFNAEEARQLALSVTRTAGPDGQTCLQLGSHRFINGYIEKNVAIRVRGRGGGEVWLRGDEKTTRVRGRGEGS